jgi:hypothetical protein
MKTLTVMLIFVTVMCSLALPCCADPDLTLPFSEGEELVFDIYYKKVKLGKSTLTFHGEKKIDGIDLYLITFCTDVPGFSDKEEIYAYKETFLPYRIVRKIKRGGAFPIKIWEDYDQESFKVDIKERGTILTKKRTIQKERPIYNPLLLTYLYRTKPFTVNPTKLKISIPMSDFDVVAKGKEMVTTCLGKRLAYVFKGEPSKFTFWLSADKEKIPVKIKGHNLLDYCFMIKTVRNILTPDLSREN